MKVNLSSKCTKPTPTYLPTYLPNKIGFNIMTVYKAPIREKNAIKVFPTYFDDIDQQEEKLHFGKIIGKILAVWLFD